MTTENSRQEEYQRDLRYHQAAVTRKIEEKVSQDPRALGLDPKAVAYAQKMIAMLPPSMRQGRQEIRQNEQEVYERQNRREPHYEVSRRLGSYQVPLMTESELYQYYPWDGGLYDVDNLWLLPIISEKVGHFCIQSPKGVYLWSELDKSSTSLGVTALARLKLLQLDRPSLVKNGLVVLRTLSVVTEKEYTVIVRGSRARHAGGQWVQEAAIFAATKARRVRFDLFDPHEQPGTEIYRYGTSEITIRRIRGMYTGDGHEYTVSIDDAWTTAEEVGDRAPRSKYWSTKDLGSKSDAFFHTYEGRIFSHEPVESSTAVCKCDLCRTVHSFTAGANAILVRRLLVTLGARSCATDIWADELKARDLVIELRKGAQPRDSSRAQRLYEFHKGRVGDRVVTQGPEMPKVPLTGYFKGRRVVFVGVAPSILGDESYETVHGSSFTSDLDSITITDHVSGVISTGSHTVWAPMPVPGFASTGRIYRNYKEQKLVDTGIAPLQKAICVYVGGKEYQYDDIMSMEGIFRVPRTVPPEYVSGPGGKDTRKVTVLNSTKVFKGGGFYLTTGQYGSFSPGADRPTRCNVCQRTGAFTCTKHLLYTKTAIYPKEWAHLFKLLEPG